VPPLCHERPIASPPPPPSVSHDIQFIDLAAQQARLRSKLDVAIARILDEGYIMGLSPASRSSFRPSAAQNARLSCANGTDALQIALMIEGVGRRRRGVRAVLHLRGDGGSVPGWSAPRRSSSRSTRHVQHRSRPSLERASRGHAKAGADAGARDPVDLFGLPADYDALIAIAQRAWPVGDRRRGKGVYVYDTQGKELHRGHGRPVVRRPRLRRGANWSRPRPSRCALPYYHMFGAKTHGAGDRAGREAEGNRAGADVEGVLRQSSGSEANDTQVKLVWYYNNALGRPKKKKIISRQKAYHGVTIMAASA
jgi:hypothetical protein